MNVGLARLRILHYRHELQSVVPTVMGPLRHRPALLVQLEDCEGAEGWGEIWCNFPPDGDLHRARMAANVLGAALEHIDSSTDNPFSKIVSRLHRLVLQAGEPGPVAQLAAGVDIALGDLAARRSGQSLTTWLGGSSRDVPAYASGISPERHTEQIERMRNLGYKRFKQRIGFGPDEGLGAAKETASALSSSERLMLDANQAWDLATARQRCQQLAPLDLVWLEEPLPADTSSEEWQALAALAPMPLAAGENLNNENAFNQAASATFWKYLQPDICKWGGLSGGLAVAHRAEKNGLTYCPHFLGGGVGLLASAHLLAAVGGAGFLEVDGSENPLLEVLSGQGLEVSDGLFRLPTNPGLGYRPDLEAVAEKLISTVEIRL